ncbi:hypothetical protein LWI28_027133 [Acer negundo]|uniref:Uncharacterized protein n=1 Tax=Acer negundo TaxID=4023 RepID=A0AAD5P6D4_ACENE|nr:hypothetical protein LWI28_027133 [Acer negundo]KAK4859140.1 hypothetical protein QYF36_000080 [Acer negundo]
MDDSETEVASILLELPQLIYESEFLGCRFSFKWGVKRRRSSPSPSSSSSVKVDTTTQTTTTLPAVRFPSLPSPPSVPQSSSAPVGPSLACETEKSKALSPSTPLLFSPSESDDKSNQARRKVSLKRKREECLQMIDKLTESKQSFKEEIKNVKRHCDQLKALNLKLKARKQMITTLGFQKETHQIQLCSSNLTMEQLVVPQPTTAIQFHHHHQSLYRLEQAPLIMDHHHHHNQTAHNSAVTLNPCDGKSLVSFLVNDNVVGPLGIPDLNLSLDQSSFELESEQQQQQQQQQQNPSMAADQIGTRASAAAQARQRRIQICRSKNPNAAASKLRFPVYR